MKTMNTLLTLAFTLLLSVTITNNTNTEPISEVSETEKMAFTLSGTVTSGHPDLSWTTVPGANQYELNRLPVPFFGSGKSKTFRLGTSTSYLDSDVLGAVLGSGFQEVRYTIDAFYEGTDSQGNDFKHLLDSDGTVKYTATSIN